MYICNRFLKKLMRKVFITVLFSFCLCPVLAQSVYERIIQDRDKAASNYYAYPAPEDIDLTPAPKGKKPFYISHYGRHGSRYLIHQREYDYPYITFHKADSLGKLSALGKEFLRRITLLRDEARNRLGELTPLGAVQHEDIAQRMYRNFPEVFKGKTHVDAKSTVVIRCILSMQNAILGLKELNPQLEFTSDASQHDMYYMNLQDRKLYNQKWTKEARQQYAAFCHRHENHTDPIDRLFNDTLYSRHHINPYRLNLALFKLASSVQGTEEGKNFSLFDLYTDEELYNNWLQVNAYWYIIYGACPLNGGTQPFSQRNLLRVMIQEADSCIALDKPGASLRFGHETIVLPLTCLLGINGFDQQIDDLEQLVDHGWVNYQVYPMAANIQMVFYRKNPKDKEVLFKVLLNEREATLPLPTDCEPYYHWSDFRDYYLKKLETYKE